MTSVPRPMTILPAIRERGVWVVRLPDGTRVASPSDAVVRERVKALAQASVRFEQGEGSRDA